jgi:DNA-binding response OmpR family regulator
MDGSKTILCIEDDHFISELYTRALRKAGYQVDCTISGLDGLEKVRTGKYAVVLLDIMTPDMTGIELLNQLRGHDNEAFPDTKIIITTNLDEDDDTKATLEHMADGYLVKAEITPSKLVEIVQQLTNQSGA